MDEDRHVAQVQKNFYWCTRVAQTVLQHFLHFSQNQHEMSAIFPAHNFECSADYYSAMKSTFSHKYRVIKMV
jgi:hypothetical protein